MQELTDANLRHPKKEAQQKLKDDMQKMRLGLGKIVQVYRKQEAEEKVFVTPPQQRCPVETQNFKFTDINKSSQVKLFTQIISFILVYIKLNFY